MRFLDAMQQHGWGGSLRLAWQAGVDRLRPSRTSQQRRAAAHRDRQLTGSLNELEMLRRFGAI